MPMTRPFPSWFPVWARPKPRGCGPMCAMVVLQAIPSLLAMWFAYSEDRKGQHPKQHLSNFSGIPQADGYAGFHHLYEGGRIREAACWAHVRRKFYDIHVTTGSAIAAEAIERIGLLYDIEREIRGKSVDIRLEVRHIRA